MTTQQKVFDHIKKIAAEHEADIEINFDAANTGKIFIRRDFEALIYGSFNFQSGYATVDLDFDTFHLDYTRKSSFMKLFEAIEDELTARDDS